MVAPIDEVAEEGMEIDDNGEGGGARPEPRADEPGDDPPPHDHDTYDRIQYDQEQNLCDNTV